MRDYDLELLTAQVEDIARNAGWDSYTLLKLILEWLRDQSLTDPLTIYLNGLADEE